MLAVVLYQNLFKDQFKKKPVEEVSITLSIKIGYALAVLGDLPGLFLGFELLMQKNPNKKSFYSLSSFLSLQKPKD